MIAAFNFLNDLKSTSYRIFGRIAFSFLYFYSLVYLYLDNVVKSMLIFLAT